MTNTKKNLTLISLFSGAGGMDLGFKKAGFEILFANDFFQEAVETYSKNVGKEVVYGDITKISSNDIPNNPDVIIGGFPCQGFSIANSKRSMKDERNFLYKELLRIIKDKKPKIFVAENVKGLLSMEKGKIIELIIKDFEKLGYKVNYKILNAVEYGVPQNRERVIIIGNRIGTENLFPEPTHQKEQKITHNKKINIENKEKSPLLNYLTVEDAIGELKDIPLSNEEIVLPNGKIISQHIAYTNVKDTFYGRKYEVNQIELCEYLKRYKKKSGLSNKKIAELMQKKQTTVDHWFRNDNNSGSIPNREDYLQLKELLKLDDTYEKELTEYEEKEITYEQSLRITNWDRPSDTITATSPEIHINKQRRLSVRECARLQTFPDDFLFCGTIEKMYRQIGNAVPVLLAEKIAESIKKMLEKEKSYE